MKALYSSKSLATLALLCTLAALTQSALAMEATEAPEEIIVTGRKSLGQLRLEIEFAQDRMFGLFNELNGDERYDIHCDAIQPLGTRISQRECIPEFLRMAKERSAKAYIAGIQSGSSIMLSDANGSFSMSVLPPQAEIEYRYPLLREKMNGLIMQNPEFAEAVGEHHRLTQELERRTSSSRDAD
jgi:hypothetical protein